MNYGQCVHCGTDVYESDERVSSIIGVIHFTCDQEHKLSIDLEMKEMMEQEKAQAKRENKLLARLKRTLKPKVYGFIEFLFEDHRVGSIEIVGFDKVSGSKERARDWFGESVSIRYIWDDTSTDYWGDGYGGFIWVPIGKGRYLQMHIWG
ncbi:hypothetical protein R7007_21720 [Vibrio sp. 1636]|uniref:Uncharacterized protein n=1 Tax=Vibrio alginolyticus TaxID=663 RepID=A0A7Y0N0E8_VIBAL|nr:MULTISPECIES: hypothetical protein [Vibrio]MDW2204291.1 hypothetical protein [Vibrio sp. 1636]NMR76227.1 hypothetical protein [Vibrio alginolyticus]